MGIIDMIKEKIVKKEGLGHEEHGMKEDILRPEHLNPAYAEPEGGQETPKLSKAGRQPNLEDRWGHFDELGLPKIESSQQIFPESKPMPKDDVHSVLELIRSQNELILQKLNMIESRIRRLEERK